MAKKISQATLDRIAGEEDSRVFVKKRHVPEQKEVAPSLPMVPAPENIKQMLAEFHDKIVAEMQQPLATQPVTRVIHVGNIHRDDDDRISAADFTVTVQRKDVQPKLINEVRFDG